MKAVILAIAADGGVMPQTREHIAIAGLLGLGDGIIALTRADLADAELRGMAAEDARAAVRGTFLDGKPVIAVSSVTGEGMDLLEPAVDAMASRFAGEGGRDRVFRMPVLRSFTMEGHGLVLTGVPLSGSVEKDEAAARLGIGRAALDVAAGMLCRMGRLKDKAGLLSLLSPAGAEEGAGPVAARISEFLIRRGMSPCTMEEIAGSSGAAVEDVAEALGSLLRSGTAAAVSRKGYAYSTFVRKARETVLHLAGERGATGAAEVKQALGVTNSEASAWLELFEGEGLLRRAGRLFRLKKQS